MEGVENVLHDFNLCAKYNIHDPQEKLYLPSKITLRLIKDMKRGQASGSASDNLTTKDESADRPTSEADEGVA